MEDRSEIVGKHGLACEGKKVCHDENAGTNPGIAKNHAFFGIADGKPARALVSRRARNLYRPVPVGIRLDDRHDLYVRDHTLRMESEIGRDLGARNFDPGSIGQRLKIRSLFMVAH